MSKGWIYNLADYRQIFALTDQELQKKILDFPGGISSLNAELYALGKTIVSGDPSYRLSVKEMQDHTRQVLQNNIKSLGQHEHSSGIIHQWEQSTTLFLADYELGKKQGRYRPIELPLNQMSDRFELLLCTDLVFNPQINPVYPAQDLMQDLCQLAEEVRIFPLPDQKNIIAGELGPIMLAFQQRNFGIEVRAVNYPQRRDANAMLRVWAKECKVGN